MIHYHGTPLSSLANADSCNAGRNCGAVREQLAIPQDAAATGNGNGQRFTPRRIYTDPANHLRKRISMMSRDGLNLGCVKSVPECAACSGIPFGAGLYVATKARR